MLHKEREDLVKEGTGTKLLSLVCNLSKHSFMDGRGTVLDLKKSHNFALLYFIDGELRFIFLLKNLGKVLSVFRLEERKVSDTGDLGS